MSPGVRGQEKAGVPARAGSQHALPPPFALFGPQRVGRDPCTDEDGLLCSACETLVSSEPPSRPHPEVAFTGHLGVPEPRHADTGN